MARDNVTDGELALDEDGKFLALRVKTVANLGAYIQTGSEGGPVSNLGTLAGPYILPAAHVDVTAVYSNTHWMRPYRGNGRPEAAYVIERLVDLAADELGIDPAELRRRNMIPPDGFPYQQRLHSYSIAANSKRCMDLALEMADWRRIRETPRRSAQPRETARHRPLQFDRESGRARNRGRGIPVRPLRLAIDHFRRRHARTRTRDRFQADGQRIGSASIPAISFTPHGDTDIVFFGQGTGGSRTSTIGGLRSCGMATKNHRESQTRRRAI